MRMRWWLVQHICTDYWTPVRALTVFGIPLVTFFYRARGPYRDYDDALRDGMLLEKDHG